MAFLGQEFKADELPEPQSFDPIPGGEYTATVTRSELKQTKAGTGQYISLGWQVEGPSHQGRIVFDNININNPSEKAEEIGRRQLNELLRAIGMARVSDTDELIGSTCVIRVGVEKSEQYGDKNNVKGYKALNGASAPRVATLATATASTSNGAAPPWARK
jgi:hypothetical protein